jgi:hypothetical protein
MKLAIRVLVSLVVLLLSSNPTLAGCVDLGSATRWWRVDSHTIVIYRGRKAIAFLKIPFCDIDGSSEIHMIEDYVCSGDKITVDGRACVIEEVETLD